MLNSFNTSLNEETITILYVETRTIITDDIEFINLIICTFIVLYNNTEHLFVLQKYGFIVVQGVDKITSC